MFIFQLFCVTVPPLIKPEIPHIKPELSDGLNDTVANEPTDEEQLAGGKEAPLDDRSPRSNHEYDKHNSDRGAPLGDQLSSGNCFFDLYYFESTIPNLIGY